MERSDGTLGDLRVGAHTSIAGGLHLALERGAEAGCDVVQIFSKSNQQWAARPINEPDLAAWGEARARTGVAPELVHASYLINLASPDRALREKSIRSLEVEYRRAAMLGVPRLVLHPGAHLGSGEAAGIRRVAAALDRVLARHPDDPTRILLETTAGQKSSLGHCFDHFGDVLALAREPDRLGVCIDTCHLHAAGYDLGTAAGWQRTLESCDSALGPGRIEAVHANDSKTPRGSRVDRHEHLGRGSIGLGAFRRLVNEPRLAGAPMVLETPKPTPHADAINLAILRALHGKRRVGAAAKRLARQPLDRPPGAA